MEANEADSLSNLVVPFTHSTDSLPHSCTAVQDEGLVGSCGAASNAVRTRHSTIVL